MQKGNGLSTPVFWDHLPLINADEPFPAKSTINKEKQLLHISLLFFNCSMCAQWLRGNIEFVEEVFES